MAIYGRCPFPILPYLFRPVFCSVLYMFVMCFCDLFVFVLVLRCIICVFLWLFFVMMVRLWRVGGAKFLLFQMILIRYWSFNLLFWTSVAYTAASIHSQAAIEPPVKHLSYEWSFTGRLILAWECMLTGICAWLKCFYMLTCDDFEGDW